MCLFLVSLARPPWLGNREKQELYQNGQKLRISILKRSNRTWKNKDYLRFAPGKHEPFFLASALLLFRVFLAISRVETFTKRKMTVSPWVNSTGKIIRLLTLAYDSRTTCTIGSFFAKGNCVGAASCRRRAKDERENCGSLLLEASSVGG